MEWGIKELECSLPWEAFLIKMVIGVNALFTEHFVLLELNVESLGR